MARWALIAGPKGSAKSQHALALREALRRKGITVGGFIQLSQRAKTAGRCHDLMHLRTGQRLRLAEHEAEESSDEWVAFCSMLFRPSGFHDAAQWLDEDLEQAQVFIIGDVSKLEVAGGGHFETVRRALALDDEVIVVLMVRADQLFYVIEKFGLDEDLVACLELPAGGESVKAFIADVLRAARPRSRSRGRMNPS